MTVSTRLTDDMRNNRWYKYWIIDQIPSGLDYNDSSIVDTDFPSKDELSNHSILLPTSEEIPSTKEEGPYEATIKEKLSAMNYIGVMVPDQNKIIEFLSEREDIYRLIYQMVERLREEFPESELSLELYSEPEFSEEYPTIYVRQTRYENDIMERIEKIQDNFYQRFEDTSGEVLITSDFRSPRF